MIKHSSSKVNRINHAIRQRDMVPRSLFPWVVQDTQRYLPHISMNEVADTFGIPRKELLKYVDTQVDEARACQSLPFTCLLIVVFTAMVLEHDHPEVTRAVQHSLTANLTNVSFSYANGISHSSFEDIHDQVDFWSWVGKGLLPTIFGKDADEQPLENDTSTDTDNSNVTWLSFNRIVGGLRFRQLRSSLGECEREGNIPGLYDAECMDWDLYRLQPGIGLWNRKALQIEPAEREEWIFMTDDYNLVVLPWLIQQEADRWWSPGTVKVEITLVSYNGEYGLHTLTRVNLFFSSTGQVWRRIVSESTYADWHARWFQFVIDILWLLCLAYLLSSQGRLIYYSLKDRGWKVTFTQTFGVWQAIDFLVALWGLICVIVFLMTIPNRNVLNRSLQLIGSVSQTRGNSAFEDELATYLDAMEEACWQVWVLRLLLSVWPFSVLMRCFLAFASQSRMALVTRTFGRACSGTSWSELDSLVSDSLVRADVRQFKRELALRLGSDGLHDNKPSHDGLLADLAWWC